MESRLLEVGPVGVCTIPLSSVEDTQRLCLSRTLLYIEFKDSRREVIYSVADARELEHEHGYRTVGGNVTGSVA
jgi:hypothetical protein